MKTTRNLSWLAVAGAMAGLAMPALAQDEDRPRRGPRPEGREGAARGTLMAALDRNGDGALDQNEIDMAVVVLRRMDRDKDGKVTGEEVASAPVRQGRPGGDRGGRTRGGPEGRPGGGRGPGPEMLARLDRDGDGKISKEEAPDRMAQNFDRIDLDGDGFIDKAEQEKMLEVMRQRFRERGGQRSDQRRRPDPDAGEGGTDKPKRPDRPKRPEKDKE